MPTPKIKRFHMDLGDAEFYIQWGIVTVAFIIVMLWWWFAISGAPR